MDFRLAPPDEAFRDEVRQWLAANLAPEITDGRLDDNWPGEGRWEAVMDFSRRLASRGWLTASWPMQFGGSEFSHIRQSVLSEELSYAGAPINVNTNRLGYTGPTLIAHGTEEQKARHLPPIARGEIMWIQGFSEPGAGSDLAALSTRAVRDGDFYVINGQKIWTSFGHHGDWMILLARTDPAAPKHRGLTYLLVDMSTPGITVRPLENLHGETPFCEVFFEDVRIPVSDRVGEENRGWYIATTTLDYERSSVASSAACRRLVEQLCRTVSERREAAGFTRASATAWAVLADLAIQAAVGRWLCFRVVAMQSKGLAPTMEASIAKLYNSELLQRIGQAAVRLCGTEAQIVSGPRSVSGGLWTRHYQASTARTIGGGTSEIQRSIIANRGLGLPR